MSQVESRALALAGMVQACHLVSTVARSGLVSQNSLEASLLSIFVTNPGDVRDVYAGTGGVALGLKVTNDLMSRFQFAHHGDILRYALGLVQLERKLSRQPERLREIGARINSIDAQRIRSSGIDDDVIRRLAEVYEETAGRIEPRIQVLGRQNHLQNTANVNKIRALLLAGLRSAVLWHQLGGRRWHLLLARRPLADAVQRLSAGANEIQIKH